MSTGLGLEAGGGRPVVAISRFSRFLAEIGIDHIEQLDRQLLERYLADLGHERHPQRRGAHIGLLNRFFVAIRQHRWYPGLPATALFFPDDHPRRPDKLPRALAEQVMAQLEQPANLDRFDNPSYRLITVILMHCGLRVTDALRLRADCVITDTDGAPYLRYFNHKMHRDALVPIDTELADAIGHHRHRNTALAGRHTGSCSHAPPRTSTAPTRSAPRPIGWPCSAGSTPATSATNTTGRVHLTPHQWRHTLGTRLINRDVPQEIVRRILDHDSPQMTSHYARLHDDTVRRHWEAARKIDITAAQSPMSPTGRSPTLPGPNNVSPAPPKPCPTATAGCRCNDPARTPTPV